MRAIIGWWLLMATAGGAAALEPVDAMSAEESIKWAIAEYGDELAMTSSFGIHSALLLHMVTNIQQNIPVIFIDTGGSF